MNLYFRLIRLFFMVKALNRKSGYIGAEDATEIDFRVWPFDMDINIHMNNARYLSIMDLGRIYHTARIGLFKSIMRYKWMPVVGKIEIKYIRSIDAFQKYTLRTELEGSDEKYFYMKQTFIRDGHEVAVAHVRGLFLDRKGKKIPSLEVMKHINVENPLNEHDQNH